jgi:hypothetical protein
MVMASEGKQSRTMFLVATVTNVAVGFLLAVAGPHFVKGRTAMVYARP